MKKLMLAVAIALASGSAVAQAPARVLPHRLTGAEIRATYVGNMAYGVGRFGPKTIARYFAPDGQVRFRSPDANGIGTYRITDDDMSSSTLGAAGHIDFVGVAIGTLKAGSFQIG